jgi:hypothetical protein
MFFDGDFRELEIPLVSGIFQEPVHLRDSGWTDSG